MDESGNQFVREYGRLHIELLPPNSILLVKGAFVTPPDECWCFSTVTVD